MFGVPKLEPTKLIIISLNSIKTNWIAHRREYESRNSSFPFQNSNEQVNHNFDRHPAGDIAYRGTIEIQESISMEIRGF